jgi:cell division protein FtsB
VAEDTTTETAAEPISADQAAALVARIDELTAENEKLRAPDMITPQRQKEIWGEQMIDGLTRGGRA